MFSYDQYEKIIKRIQEKIPIRDYSEVDKNTTEFCILRHDVEFSVKRAYDLAVFENELGIKSTYFFQIRNNCYNIYSNVNRKMITQIVGLGHKVGLHCNTSSLQHIDDLENYIKTDCEILQTMLGLEIDRFSFHRPKREHFEPNLRIDGLINAYTDEYFTLTDNLDNRDILYLSDSNHMWKWGNPLEANLNKHKKIQILLHPFSWSRDGGDNLKNFIKILEEKDLELRQSINNEMKTFPSGLL